MNSAHKVVHEGEEYERMGWGGVNLGVWQSPSLVRKISIKSGKKPEDYYWYHRKIVNYRQLKQTASGASLGPTAMLNAPRVAPTPKLERWRMT